MITKHVLSISFYMYIILFSTSSAFAAVDLSPYKPTAWDDFVVVANVPDATTDSTVYANVTCFIRYAIANFGTEASGSFFVAISDQTENRTYRVWIGSLGAGRYGSGHIELTFTIAGNHTLRMTVDDENEVSESNESNNEYIRQIYVNAPPSDTPDPNMAIFEDTFPSQTIDIAKWIIVNDATIDDAGIDEISGSYSLCLNGYPSGGDSVESRVIDLSLYSHVTLSYWYQQTGGGESPDNGDDLVIEYHDGFSWIELDRQLGSDPDMLTFVKRTIDLPVMALHENFRLRIRSIGSANVTEVYDDWFIDDIRIAPSPREVKLIAPDGAAEDKFGISVSISGDYAIIGAPYHDSSGSDSGAAYVFKRLANEWTYQDKLQALDITAGDLFGWSVSMDGNYAIIGSRGTFTTALNPFASSPNRSGVAYIFKRSGQRWEQQQKVQPSDTKPEDRFGYSVSISGDYVIIGAPGDGDGLQTGSGSTYIFKRETALTRDMADRWVQEDKLIASDGDYSDHFGNSVSISGDYAIVGAVDADVFSMWSGEGAAYIFKQSGSNWIEQTKLIQPMEAIGGPIRSTWYRFGWSVSIVDDNALVGVFGGFDQDGIDTGSAYVYKRNEQTWTKLVRLLASDGSPEDAFGCSVSSSGDYTIVGASGDDDDGVESGSAYIFQREGNQWLPRDKVLPSDGTTGANFGYSVSISGSNAIVGAPGDDYNNGSVYIFKL